MREPGIDRLVTVPDRLLRWSPVGEATFLFLALLCVAAIAGIVLIIGPTYIAAPWDVFVLIDGAWRISNGQIPHTDFHNPIGALVYAVFAFGMRIDGPSLQALAYGNSIFLSLVGLWTMAISYKRLTPVFGLILTTFIVVLLAATRPLGYDVETTTYAMLYNRYGWALLSILMIQLLLAPKSEAARFAVFDSLSAGLLLGLLFFCKITFFIVGVGVYGFSLALRPELRWTAWLSFVGFAAVCAAAWAILGISVGDYLADIAAASESQSLADRGYRLFRSGIDAMPQLALLGLCWLLVVALPNTRGRRLWSEPVKITLSLALVVGGGMFLTVGNTGEAGEIPVLVVAAIILSDYALRHGWAAPNSHTWRSAWIVLGLPLVLFFQIFISDARSLANSLERRDYVASGAPASQRFDAEPLRDFVIPDWSNWKTAYWLAKEVPSKINEGLLVLRRNGVEHRKTLVLALTDPFSFALGLPSPKGVPLWWDLNMSHSEGQYPPPGPLFTEVDNVMLPILDERAEGCCKETAVKLREEYDTYLREHFTEVDHSDNWLLLKRVGRVAVQK
jgi:hypothetical protein